MSGKDYRTLLQEYLDDSPQLMPVEEWAEELGQAEAPADLVPMLEAWLPELSRIERARLANLFGTVGEKRVVPLMLAELDRRDSHRFTFAACLARLGELAGYQVIEEIAALSEDDPDGVPAVWITSELEALDTDEARALLDRLSQG